VSGTCFTITTLLHFMVIPSFSPVQGFHRISALLRQAAHKARTTRM
jgi:hypothetical protein